MPVLIETLWNVNESQNVESAYTVRRINRNIVECKFYLHTIRQSDIFVLIETLWNVNTV